MSIEYLGPLETKPHYDEDVRAEALKQGIDPNLAVAVHRREYNPKQWASPKGARGPMQLMPGTAKDLGVDPDDPAQNIEGGLRYLKQQLDSHGGDVRLALASYNAGPKAVEKYGGVPPYRETREYVKNITERYAKLKGPSGVEYLGPLESKVQEKVQDVEYLGPMDIESAPEKQSSQADVEYLGPIENQSSVPSMPSAAPNEPIEGFDEFGLPAPEVSNNLTSQLSPIAAAPSAGPSEPEPLKIPAPVKGFDEFGLPTSEVSENFKALPPAVSAAPQQPSIPAPTSAPAPQVAGFDEFGFPVPEVSPDFQALPPAEPTVTPPVVQDALRPYANVGAIAAGSFNRGMASFSKGLNDISTWLSKTTGFPKGGLFEAAEKEYRENAKFWDSKVQQSGLTEEIAGEFLGGAAPGMAEFMLGPLYAGARGYAQEGWSGAMREGIKRLVMGKILEAANLLTTPARTTALAGVGAVEEAARGGSPRDIAKSAGVMAGFGLAGGPGEVTGREALSRAPELVKEVKGTFSGEPKEAGAQAKEALGDVAEDKLKNLAKGGLPKRSSAGPVPPEETVPKEAGVQAVEVPAAENPPRVQEQLNARLWSGEAYVDESAGAPFQKAEKARQVGRRETAELPVPLGGENTPALRDETVQLREEARRSTIIKRVQDAFEIPIRQGRFRQKAEGIYKPGERVVRLKRANDVEVVIHEVGHDLHRLMNFPRNLPEEVRALAYEGAKSVNREGFAEFVRLYVTNQAEAEARAPAFYRAFETRLQERPDIQEAFVTARQAWEEYIAAPSVARVMSTIVSGKESRRRLLPTFNEIYTSLVDELNPLKAVRDAAAKKARTSIPAGRDPYLIAWLNRGWARKAEQFTKWATFRESSDGVEFTGPSLREILEPIERAGQRKLLDAYLVAKRTLSDERILGGFQGVLRRPDFERTVSELEPLFSETAERLYQYSDSLFRYLVDSGRISEDTYQSAKQKNLFYAPLYRVLDVDTPSGGLSKRRFGNVFNPIKRLKGSSRDIVSPTEGMLYNTYAIVNAAERNKVGAALIELSKIPGMGEYIEKLPPRMQPVNMTTEEAFASLAKQLGVDRAEFDRLGLSELPELLTAFRPNYTPKGNEVIFYNQGKPEVYEVSPELHKAIANTDPAVTGLTTKILSFPAKALRAGATLTLEFAARNPVRDQLSAFIYSKYGYVPGYDLVRGIFHVLKKDELYQQFNASGAAHAALVSMDRNYLAKSLDELLRSRRVLDLGKMVIRHPVEALRALSELTEEATRVGEFARGIEKEGTSRPGLMKAGQAARDVTLDFSRTGAQTKAINSIIAFWNAQVQGVDKMVRAFKDSPARTLVKTAISITAPSVLLWLAQKDDPYYQEIPAWRKTLLWNIVTHKPDGTLNHVWSIPKPFELGILFGSFPEAALEWTYRRDPHGMQETAKGLLDALTPGVVPTAAVPILEWWGNKSLFFDRPIVPRGREDLKPSLQYGERTSETFKLVAKGLEKVPGLEELANPAKLENLFRGYTGGLGAYGTHSIDQVIDALGTGAGITPAKPKEGLEDLPGIRGFMWRFPNASTDSIERFYRRLERVRTEWESRKDEVGIRGLSTILPGAKLPTGVKPPELETLEVRAEALSKLRKLADVTYSNRLMTPDQKREMLDKYYLTMINVARSGLGRAPIGPGKGGNP